MSRAATIADAEVVARSVFRHPSLREHQRRIIEAVLGQRDAVIVAATGSGKSLCFQIPPLALQRAQPGVAWMTIVVSPLVSLMRDQSAALQQKGVQVRRPRQPPPSAQRSPSRLDFTELAHPSSHRHVH